MSSPRSEVAELCLSAPMEGLSRKLPFCIFNVFTPKIPNEFLLCVRAEATNKEDRASLHSLGMEA